jgi:hypothetical protein
MQDRSIEVPFVGARQPRLARVPRLAAVAALTLVASIAAAAPAAAIEGGTKDDGAHPAVGAMGIPNGSSYRAVCTGTLISPTVFLTAAHCISAAAYLSGGDTVWVTFAENIGDPGAITWLEGRGYSHPRFDGIYRFDTGVVVLKDPINNVTPAQLPSAGLLDGMAKEKTLRGASFTVVGYGRGAKVLPGNQWPWHPPTDERRWVVLGFSSLEKQFLHQTQNRAQGYGGACYGDSGGPSFLGAGAGETAIVVGVTSTGDGPCYATNVVSRVDTAWARAFLDDYVVLP